MTKKLAAAAAVAAALTPEAGGAEALPPPDAATPQDAAPIGDSDVLASQQAFVDAIEKPERLTVRALSPRGFCRAGIRWPVEGRTVYRDDLTPEQWAAVETEPRLAVAPAKE